MSLRQFGAFLRSFSAASLCDWKSQSPPARKCPFIPRGHLSMCPQRAASLFILNSSRRPCDDAYVASANHPFEELTELVGRRTISPQRRTRGRSTAYVSDGRGRAFFFDSIDGSGSPPSAWPYLFSLSRNARLRRTPPLLWRTLLLRSRRSHRSRTPELPCSRFPSQCSLRSS